MLNQFAFIGNRRFVLEEMIRAGVELSSIFVIAGSHLERDLKNGAINSALNYEVVHSKNQLLSMLKDIDVDILISNGCPYILPVDQLPQAKYINIHPSFLPDLRGVDPVIGSILFKRDAGATCHIMDSGIDTGPVISQVRIPFTDDLDVVTLYQLSFIAEQQVFSEALAIEFKSQFEQPHDSVGLYYSRVDRDRTINFFESNDLLIQKIKAFNNKSLGSYFNIEETSYHVFSVQRMQNSYLLKYLEHFPDCVVGMSYENGIVFRKDGEVLRFLDVFSANGKPVPVGVHLRPETDAVL